VYFKGNAPRIDIGARPSGAYFGEKWYDAGDQQQRLTVHIDPKTEGWIAPGRTGAPEKWPLEFGWMQAYPVKADVSSWAATIPSGIVAVVAEIAGDSTSVPETWSANFPQYAEKFGADFAASLLKPTGKTDASGNALKVWHDYVAGTDPTDVDDVFRATIEIVNGSPVISWSPVLPAAETAKRVYAVYGRKSILSAEWEVVADGHAADYNWLKRHAGYWLGVALAAVDDFQVFGVLFRVGNFGGVFRLPFLVLSVELLGLAAQLRDFICCLAQFVTGGRADSPCFCLKCEKLFVGFCGGMDIWAFALKRGFVYELGLEGLGFSCQLIVFVEAFLLLGREVPVGA